MILFHLVDLEILESSGITISRNYHKLLDKIEEELRLILAFEPVDEFIIFSPSFAYESIIAREIIKRCYILVENGLIRYYMREDNLVDFEEKKIDNYSRIFSQSLQLKNAYSKNNIKKIKQIYVPIERKQNLTGKSSYEFFVPQFVINSNRMGRDIGDFLKRLDETERDSFLWISVLNQAKTSGISDKEIRDLSIRSLMNSSYLHSYINSGIKIPINSKVIPNPKIRIDLKNNTVDLDKFLTLSKLLGIHNSLINMPLDEFVELKYNTDFIQSIKNSLEIYEKCTDITDLNKEKVNINKIISRITKYTEDGIVKQEIFIVHGHDSGAKETLARTLERAGLRPIILHEQSSSGDVLISKIEKYTNVAYAIIIYTECDSCFTNNDKSEIKKRARQNVVFEHGYLIAKLGLAKVCALVKGDVELPSDISGIVYIPMDDNGAWKVSLAKELNNADIKFNLEKFVGMN